MKRHKSNRKRTTVDPFIVSDHQQNPRGKQCQHKCADKKACKHQCCKAGLLLAGGNTGRNGSVDPIDQNLQVVVSVAAGPIEPLCHHTCLDKHRCKHECCKAHVLYGSGSMLTLDSDEPVLVLLNWYLFPVCNDTRVNHIGVGGHIVPRQIADGAPLRGWRSSRIVQRTGVNTVKSCSGRSYRLLGALNRTRTAHNLYAPFVLNSFALGFPVDWQHVLHSFYTLRLALPHFNGNDDQTFSVGTSLIPRKAIENADHGDDQKQKARWLRSRSNASHGSYAADEVDNREKRPLVFADTRRSKRVRKTNGSNTSNKRRNSRKKG